MSPWLIVALCFVLVWALGWGFIQSELNTNTPKGGDDWSVKVTSGSQPTSRDYRPCWRWYTQIYYADELSSENSYPRLGFDAGYDSRLGARMGAAARLRALRATDTSSEVIR